MLPVNLYSDNVAPAAPEIMAALARVNVGPAQPYGMDPETKALKKSSRNAPTFTSVFANALISEARADEQIVAITAAMLSRTV